MRSARLGVTLVLLVLAAVPAFAQAQAQAPHSGVRGTVLDTTCEIGCLPPCPPPPTCRPTEVVPCPQAEAASVGAVAAGASIVCPMLRAPDVCTLAGCPPPPVETPDYPPYEGEAATVLVRRAGTAEVLGRVPVEAGRFTAHLAPGRYVLRAHVAEPCWSGNRQVVEIEPDRWVPLVLRVANGCVAHPDGTSG